MLRLGLGLTVESSRVAAFGHFFRSVWAISRSDVAMLCGTRHHGSAPAVNRPARPVCLCQRDDLETGPPGLRLRREPKDSPAPSPAPGIEGKTGLLQARRRVTRQEKILQLSGLIVDLSQPRGDSRLRSVRRRWLLQIHTLVSSLGRDLWSGWRDTENFTADRRHVKRESGLLETGAQRPRFVSSQSCSRTARLRRSSVRLTMVFTPAQKTSPFATGSPWRTSVAWFPRLLDVNGALAGWDDVFSVILGRVPAAWDA